MVQGEQSRQRGFAFTRTAEHHARTLTAGSVAGMVFGVLFGACVIVVRSTVSDVDLSGAWLKEGASSVEWALALLPFAGIFFLWYIGVSRQRLGRWEDRFISTLILGSGLVFITLVFAAAAMAGAMIAAYYRDPIGFPGSPTYLFISSAVTKLFGVYALRMAAVFLFCQATAWLRHGLMPKWLAVSSFIVALVLLFVVSEAAWVVLVFPAWVFAVSAYLFSIRGQAPEMEVTPAHDVEGAGAEAEERPSGVDSSA